MIRPTDKVLRALAALEGDQNFQTILGWISDSRETERDAVELAHDGDRAMQFAGRAASLSEILGYARNARETLRKTG